MTSLVFSKNFLGEPDRFSMPVMNGIVFYKQYDLFYLNVELAQKTSDIETTMPPSSWVDKYACCKKKL